MTKGFGSGIVEGLTQDGKDVVKWVTSPIEQLSQISDTAQMLWEIGRTPGGYEALFDAIGDQAKAGWQRISTMPDSDEKDREIGLLAGGGLYFIATTGIAPEKLTAKFPGIAAKIERLKNVVYISKNGDDVIQYVGITNNYARRAAEHLRTKGIDIQRIMEGLSRSDARAVEQTLIEIHGLEKNGGTLMNKINSIASSNPSYAQQLERGYELLKTIGME